MSAALKRIPESTGYVVTDEQLARLGNGDIRAGRKALRMMLADTAEPEIAVDAYPYPAEVQFGVPTDEPELLRLMTAELHETGGSRVAPISVDRMSELVRPALQQKRGMVGVILGEQPGRLAGYIVLLPERWWWSEAQRVAEAGCYVDPAYRHLPYGRRLLQFANWVSDEWTRGFGYRVYLMTSVLNAEGAERKVRMWRRYGKQVGGYFLYPPPPARSA